MKLTQAEINNCIGLKSLLIARDRQGNIVRVTSPIMLTPWTFDGSTWVLDAHQEPAEDNTAGVYVAYNTKEARRYLGTLCKVILSGTIVIGEHGARGQRARVLEVQPCESAKRKRLFSVRM